MTDRHHRALDALLMIGTIAAEYMPNGSLITEGVRIMDLLIDAHSAEIRRLQEALAWHETELASTKSELSAALRVIDDFAQAPTTEPAYDGPFIITAGWREAEASQKAYDIARDMAMTSDGGVAIIARPLRVATVSIEMKDYGHVPASQPAAAA